MTTNLRIAICEMPHKQYLVSIYEAGLIAYSFYATLEGLSDLGALIAIAAARLPV